MTKEQEIQKYMEKLDISREEAEQLWEDDHEGYESPEMVEMEKKAKQLKRYEKSGVAKKRTPKERKVDEEKKHLVMYGFQRIVKDEKELAVELYSHENLDKQMISHPTCFVSRDTYKDFGMFDTKYRSASDYDFMMRLYHKTDTVFVPIYKVITNFERGGMSASGVGQKETAMIRHEYGLVPKSRIWYESVHGFIVRVYRKIK